MLGGETPFDITEEDTPEAVLKKLNGNKLKLSGGNWDLISNEAKVRTYFLELFVLDIFKAAILSYFLEQVLMEYMDMICSLESNLFFVSINSVRIRSRL